MGLQVSSNRAVSARHLGVHQKKMCKCLHHLRMSQFFQIRLCEWCWALLYSTRLALGARLSDWVVWNRLL